MNKPLQVYVDEADLSRLDAWARERGWTKSQAVRAAIRVLTRPPAQDPLLEASGMIEGLPPDMSERFDHYLNETFNAKEPQARYRARKRARSRLRG